MYKWEPRECDPVDGIPYVKKAPVVLEKDGVQETFTTQAAVDEAWANGWHDTGRPETADPIKKRPGRPTRVKDDDSE